MFRYTHDAALVSDPAWLLRGLAPDRAMLRNPHPDPIPPSDLRIDSNVPASLHPADPSLPDHMPSQAQVWVLRPRTRRPAPPAGSTRRNPSVRLHNRLSTCLPDQAS